MPQDNVPTLSQQTIDDFGEQWTRFTNNDGFYGSKALFEDMADKMAANLPLDRREQFKRMMTADLDIAALTKAMTDAMVKHFTTDELKALADFYGSPVGKSAMQKFGAYMADVMPAMQAEMLKAQAKLNQSLPNQSPK